MTAQQKEYKQAKKAIGTFSQPFNGTPEEYTQACETLKNKEAALIQWAQNRPEVAHLIDSRHMANPAFKGHVIEAILKIK